MQQGLPVMLSSPTRATQKENSAVSPTRCAGTRPTTSERIPSTAPAAETIHSPPSLPERRFDRVLGKFEDDVAKKKVAQQRRHYHPHPSQQMIEVGVDLRERGETKGRSAAPQGLVGERWGGKEEEEDTLELSLDLSNCSDEVSAAQ